MILCHFTINEKNASMVHTHAPFLITKKITYITQSEWVQKNPFHRTKDIRLFRTPCIVFVSSKQHITLVPTHIKYL